MDIMSYNKIQNNEQNINELRTMIEELQIHNKFLYQQFETIINTINNQKSNNKKSKVEKNGDVSG